MIRELATALAENCDQLKSEQRLDTGKNLRPPARRGGRNFTLVQQLQVAACAECG